MTEQISRKVDENLILENIRIDRIDGIRDGFGIDELSPGINLIHGPNGIGKSRTAAALQSLIWPSLTSQGTTLLGNMRVSEDKWNVELDLGKAAYQKNSGSAASFKHSIPPHSHHDRYLLTLQDLLRVDNKNFALEIQTEASGGYDLGRVRSNLKIPATRRSFRPSKSASSLQETRRKLHTLRQHDDVLREQELSLNRLIAEHDNAVAADSRLRELEAARSFRNACEKLQASRLVLDSFPTQLDKMIGTEYTQVESLIHKLRKRREEQHLSKIKVSNAQDEISSTGLPEEIPSNSVTTSLRSRLTDVQRQEEQIQQIQSNVQKHKNQIDVLRNRLNQGLSEEQMESLDVTGLRTLAELSREWQQAHQTLKNQNDLAQWLGASNNLDRESIRNGMDLLSRHLRTQRSGTSGSRQQLVVVVLIGAAIVIVVEAVLLSSSMSQYALLLALLAAPLLWLAFTMKSDATEEELKEIQSQFSSLNLDTPTSWTVDEITLSLRELQRQSAQAELDSEREVRWGNLQDKRDAAAAELRAVDDKGKSFTESYGVNLKDAVPDTLEQLAKALEDWRRESDQLNGEMSRKQALESNRDSTLARISEELKSHGLNKPLYDATSAQAGIEELAERISKAQGASSALEHERQRLEKEIDPDILDLENQIESIYGEIELEPGDLIGLKALCDQVDAYREAKNAVDQANTTVTNARAHMRPESGDENLDHDAITTAMAEMSERANRRDDIQANISRIRTEIDRAQHQTQIESEVANEHQELEVLRESRTHDYSSAADRLIFELVQNRNREVNRPPVFRIANELFISFTNGAYSLELDDESDEFTAVEAETGRAVRLDNLSSGTRVQLLLAVRLAFIEESEQGVRLPIILDETLGNTDDIRARAIIDATIEIARRGRQVFYFTAQHDEIGKWSDALKSLNTPLDWTVLDLASIRGKAAANPITEYVWDHSTFVKLEIPEGTNHQALYNLLDVPAIDIHSANILEVDLWYLIPDVPSLVELGNRGVRRWGQYLNLHNGSHLQGVWSKPQYEKAKARARVIHEFFSAWRVGRPAPVTADDLKNSNQITDSFWDEVLRCAQAHNWSGAALILALEQGEVSRFRRATTEALSEWLSDNGFITDIAPLDDVMIRARVISSMNDEVQKNTLSIDEIDELLQELVQ